MYKEIDETDGRILRVLQKQGRMSNADLAEKVNLSASACHRRVARLEREKIIRHCGLPAEGRRRRYGGFRPHPSPLPRAASGGVADAVQLCLTHCL